ncbi:dihydrouridine synthase domain-containing protein [Ditylenchus destructor]|uniref:Dihydrouridine synthase domain-containing protein n=1 Tax=Ditylenchus destructor TaxID=166010 RepID=A0AAD4MRK7_9BILA|nr:dihydrouridine synthase domain-containing protein [Ditylenchus destructor]
MSEQIERFLDKACDFDEDFVSTKYVVQRILGGAQEFDPRGRATVSAGSITEICKAWGKEEKYLECKQHRLGHLQVKEGELELIDGVHVGCVSFPKKKLADCNGIDSPKSVLNKLCDVSKAKRPLYTVRKRSHDGRFDAEINVMDKR